MKTFRVFLAHAKGDSDRQIEAWCRHTTERLAAVAPANTAIVITLGRTDHAENFKRCGSWDAWARDVVDRIDYATREEVYQAVVVPNEYVGAATARIVEWAILKRRPVLMILPDGTFKPVRAIERVSDSYKDGWRLYHLP